VGAGVWLLRGDDGVLLADALSELVHRLVGAGDRSLMVDDFDGEDYLVGSVVDAAQTPPFLTEHRVVVARGVSRFGADELAPLVAYLDDPLPTTELVLTASGGRLPKSLTDKVKAAGGDVIATDAPTRPGDRQAWIDEHVAGSGLRLDAGARVLLAGQLGEDVARLSALLETLEATFGPGARLHAVDVAPFVGDAGAVPPWDLTDAIDRGDTALALANLTRLLRGGERHPLQVLATLHTHYARMLRLDGAGVADEKAAAALLGLKGSTFAARKALDQARRLGHGGIARAIAVLAEADLDLRGGREWPGELVLEVLVARLSRLVSPSRRPAATGRR